MRLYIFAVLPLPFACSPEPSHIPNPLLLPAQGVSAAVENGIYSARRAKVKRYVTQNRAALRADIAHGSGDTLNAAIMSLAGVAGSKRPALTKESTKHPVHSASPETLTIALMVHRD